MSITTTFINQIYDKLKFIEDHISPRPDDGVYFYQNLEDFKQKLIKADADLTRVKSFIKEEMFEKVKQDIFNTKLSLISKQKQLIEYEKELEKYQQTMPDQGFLRIVQQTQHGIPNGGLPTISEEDEKDAKVAQILPYLPNAKAQNKLLKQIDKLQPTDLFHNGRPVFIGPSGGHFYFNNNGNKTFLSGNQIKRAMGQL